MNPPQGMKRVQSTDERQWKQAPAWPAKKKGGGGRATDGSSILLFHLIEGARRRRNHKRKWGEERACLVKVLRGRPHLGVRHDDELVHELAKGDGRW